jgi:hypothetical protein
MADRMLRRCYCDEIIACNSRLCSLLEATEPSGFGSASENSSVASTATTNVHIPIVFQIVGKPSVQDAITTELLESQVAQLNADFLTVNLDVVNVPPVFSPRTSVKDGRISFSIDRTIRTQTNVDVYSMGFGFSGWDICNQNMKYTALGGADAIDQANKLNIWICDFSSDGFLPFDVLGYSWFPEWIGEGGCYATADGIVMLTGTIGSTLLPGLYASFGFGLGRTLTHEVGHYLSLRHIWNDCSQFACCGTLDMPRQQGPNFGRPSHPQRAGQCPDANGAASPGDMFMNYMDYVDDDYMIAFSTGQMNAMVQAAVTYRPNMVVSGAGPGPNPLPLAAPVVTDVTVGGSSTSPAVAIDIRVLGVATFSNDSSFSGRMVGNAVFNDTSTNNGMIMGDATFNDASSNLGVVTGTITCNTTGSC